MKYLVFEMLESVGIVANRRRRRVRVEHGEQN